MGGIENSVDFIVDDDAPPLAPESGRLVSKGRKRVSEDLPTTTIKLGVTKRKMLVCRNTIQRDRPSTARPTTKDPTGVPDTRDSRRISSTDSMTMANGAGTLLSDDTTLAERRGLGMDKAVSGTADGFAANSPGIFRRDRGDGVYDGQETSEINSPVGVYGNRRLSVQDSPLGASFAYQASGPDMVSDVAPGRKEKGKGKQNDRMEKGSAHGIATNSVALDGCLDMAQGPGNNGTATISTSGNSLTPSATRQRIRKKREQNRKTEGARTEEAGSPNLNSREFGAWSLEAFDLFAWRAPNLGENNFCN